MTDTTSPDKGSKSQTPTRGPVGLKEADKLPTSAPLGGSWLTFPNSRGAELVRTSAITHISINPASGQPPRGSEQRVTVEFSTTIGQRPVGAQTFDSLQMAMDWIRDHLS